ncbi:MAG: zinc-dependent metalloprotease [Actinomycetota bacterium]
MDTARVDWSMGSSAARLIDWRTAADVGRRIGGAGASIPAIERARLREDLAELVPHAQSLVTEFTGIASDGLRSRAWVMSRGEWVGANLRGLEGVLEPLAKRILGTREARAAVRRKALGAQIGVLLGYVSRKVLGQYDIFLPPDDEGLLYFVGPNVMDVERRFGLPSRDFRLWVSLHEVTHLVQFGATPWLRSHLSDLVGAYLRTVEIDAGQFIRQLKRAAEEARAGAEWRGAGVLLLLMTPEQRELFQRMQSLMSLLEGHATYVMNTVAAGRVKDLARMRRSLKDRRRSSGAERAFQRVIGFESKVRQYEAGERFVTSIVNRVGMDGFNMVWQREGNLPTMSEIANPDLWMARVARG